MYKYFLRLLASVLLLLGFSMSANAEFKVGVIYLYNLIVVMFDKIEVSAPSIIFPTAEYLNIPVKSSSVSLL